ncbi:MAG: transporter substrate-binding domain-containing protein [Desulfovibrio sp.]|nr:transporter substrate-binding domain-containing protein [Desulfovibrio sp.]
MRQLLLLCLGLVIIGIQVLLGVQTFYPQAFASREDTLGELLEEKTSVLDKIAPEDLAWLAANPIVTVGVDPNFYPLEMFDERGRYTGLGGDYLRLLSKMTGLDFRPLATSDWAATEELARQGKVDLFMAAAKTGRRSEYMLFTAPYITEPGIIMTRRGSGLDKADMGSLAGKKVAVVQDYSWHDFLKEFHPEVIAVPSATTLEALQKVAAGEADAVLDYEFNLLEKIQTGGILQMQTAGKVDSSYGHAVAVRRDRPELFNVITTALAQVTPQEREALAQKWLHQERPAGQERHWQWVFFFFVEACLLIFGLLWLYHAGVRKHTRELRARVASLEKRLAREEKARVETPAGA